MAKKKTQQSSLFKWMIGLVVGAVFIGLRIFSLQQSFWFWGDMGRDFFVLQNWAQQPFHPPLLGPQTSVFSFNHSAWYYYLLFPFFILTGHSPYATYIAILTSYAAIFIGGLMVFKKKRHWLPFIALFYLLAIHPQFVMQHRYIWNPSLITPFLLLGFWAWWRYQWQKNWRWLAVFAGSTAVAAGLNLSIAPTALVMGALFLWEQRRSKAGFWQFIGLSALANLIVHLPTLVFELRHRFLLWQNLPAERLQQLEPNFDQKLTQFFANIFLPNQPVNWSLNLGLAVIVLLLFVYLRSMKLRNNWVFTRSLSIAFFTAVLIMLFPIQMQAHFLFGVLTFLLVALARLPRKLLWAVLIVLSVLYLQPAYFQLYQERAPHTVDEQRQCMQITCQTIKTQGLEPIFVNTQTASYNHQAREYVFWLKELGCQAIDTQQFLQTPTDYMAVVADRAEFTNGQTGYYELSQFGPAEELQKIACKEDLTIHLLKRTAR
ncbi:MAG: hypothetical protein UY13_C0002G0165 [Candidatus Pacebacteria bacterium GW2011_GWB1_47_8]|nr:MAG: hypothetical protein UX28_C0001G0314 [Candidatus Pacebacteria bacterium GW2011_GWA1_46_10]KKU84253.1 MAG: hypothetical protein UY13_C0002G0165 [Candidatus Pacebacteria bacterium GW2011_GWB1_47_8]HCR81473.1 hypothetical protein [Candidatus Paceibacterota bacterium]